MLGLKRMAAGGRAGFTSTFVDTDTHLCGHWL